MDSKTAESNHTVALVVVRLLESKPSYSSSARVRKVQLYCASSALEGLHEQLPHPFQ